jgi:hypothetical protein
MESFAGLLTRRCLDRKPWLRRVRAEVTVVKARSREAKPQRPGTGPVRRPAS